MKKQNPETKNRNLIPASLAIIIFAIATFLAVVGLILLLAIEDRAIVIFGIIFAFLLCFGIVLVVAYKLSKKIDKGINKELEVAAKESAEKVEKESKKPEEIERIQDIFENVRAKTGAHTFIVQNYSFDEIPLVYKSKKESIVTYESLLEQLEKVVDTTKQYMNALIHIHYDITEPLTPEVIKNSLEKICESLNYPLRLAACDEEHKGFLVYIPCFDSIHQLQEEIEFLVKQLTVIGKRSYDKKLTVARAAMVVYPYSKEGELLKDLRKACKSKKVVNVYLPEVEFNEFDNEEVDINDANNIANITQIIEKVSALDARVEYREENEQRIKDYVALMCKYFCFDGSGLILFDNVHKDFRCQYVYGEEFFPKDSAVNPVLIDAIDKHHDINGSYYFSNRNHANNDVAYFLDYYRISSGEFFPLVISNKIAGVLYFLNRSKELFFDSYLKEKLFMFGSLLTSYVSRVSSDDEASSSNKKFKEVLRFSSTCLYSVDKNDYSLAYVSDALRPELKGEIGEKCYKALYGRDIQCKNCPIKTMKHMISELSNHTYDSHIVFKNDRDKYVHMSLKPIQKDDSSLDRFDQDFLIPSSRSLIDALRNEYLIGNSGYVSYFMIDNFIDLLKEHKEEGYIDIQKKYLEELESEGYSMYYIKANVFAMIAPSADTVKISSILQKIHLISKANGLDITYLCKSYPGSTKNEVEFYKEANKLATGFAFAEHVNEICIPDEKYARPASEEDFVIDIISKGIETGDLGVEYTPVLNNSDRLIHAVELTLCEKDPHTLEPIDSESALALLDAHGMIGKLTCGYLKVLDKILAKYGYGFFTSNNIENVIIHSEFSFITKENLKVLEELIERYKLAPGFVRFEVYEKDIFAHKDEYKRAINDLKSSGASFSVGHYLSNEVSILEIAELGSNELKFDESLTDAAMQTPAGLEKVLDLWKEAHMNKLKVSLTGIKSREQSESIHIDGSDSRVQGKYFFLPSNIDGFMTAVKLRNGSEDKFNT